MGFKKKSGRASKTGKAKDKTAKDGEESWWSEQHAFVKFCIIGLPILAVIVAIVLILVCCCKKAPEADNDLENPAQPEGQAAPAAQPAVVIPIQNPPAVQRPAPAVVRPRGLPAGSVKQPALPKPAKKKIKTATPPVSEANPIQKLPRISS